TANIAATLNIGRRDAISRHGRRWRSGGRHGHRAFEFPVLVLPAKPDVQTDGGLDAPQFLIGCRNDLELRVVGQDPAHIKSKAGPTALVQSNLDAAAEIERRLYAGIQTAEAEGIGLCLGLPCRIVRVHSKTA